MRKRNWALIAALAVMAALVSLSVGSAGTAAAAGASASGASAAGGNDAVAAVRRGKRGRRGPRGPRGPGGRQGATGPAGPPGGAVSGGGNVQKLRYVANEGTSLATIYTGNGVSLQADCGTAFIAVTARSTADNGVAGSTQFPSGNDAGTWTNPDLIGDTQDDFDINEVITLNAGGNRRPDFGNGLFAHSSANGAITTFEYYNSFDSAQGDCISFGSLFLG